jgi:hypothetical protein
MRKMEPTRADVIRVFAIERLHEAVQRGAPPVIASSFNSGMPAISPDRTMTVTVRPARGNAAWWCLLGALCLVLLAPLTLADVPPLLDYPNHLARMFVLAFVAHDPVLARFYQPHWGIIPNLALDLMVPPLLLVFPVHLVGRAVVGLALLLPVIGAAAYHRALTGRLSYWPLGSVLFAYNGALLRGFLNFIVAAGLALLLGAAWVAWREQRPARAILIGAIGAVALFFCHLMGLLFVAVLIGGHELLILWTEPFKVHRILTRIGAVAAVFVVPVALYAVSDLGQMEGAAVFRSVADKTNAALMPVMNYLWPLDLATAALCVTVLVLCLARRWCAIPLRAAAAIAVLLALFIVLPTAFKGTFDLDTRFLMMAAFVAPAALVSIAIPRRAAWIVGIGFLLLFSARMAVLMTVWHDWAGYLGQFRSVIDSVRPGDVVLTVRLPRGTENDIWTSVATARRLSDGTVVDAHLPALLLIEHRAWWPFLFDNPSQQPIETRAPFLTLAARIDVSPDPIALLARDAGDMRPITHVLVRGPVPGPREIETAGLMLVAEDGEAALFAVVRHGLSR